jgi:hypothetical protein
MYLNLFFFQTEDGGDKIHGTDRDAVKNGIVELMLKSPSGIQKQLSAAIAIIGQQDFPGKNFFLLFDILFNYLVST